jgi:hypothetical protein
MDAFTGAEASVKAAGGPGYDTAKAGTLADTPLPKDSFAAFSTMLQVLPDLFGVRLRIGAKIRRFSRAAP